MCRKLFSPNFEIGSHFLKEDFKIPMNNASVFLVTVTFYMPGSVNKLNLTYNLQQNQKSSQLHDL